MNDRARVRLPEETLRRPGDDAQVWALARQVHTGMTIPDVGRCLGSGEAPREGSEESTASGRSGVCVTCSGRFEVRNGRLVEHESAPADERESTSDDKGSHESSGR
jgi:hypothetical protein